MVIKLPDLLFLLLSLLSSSGSSGFGLSSHMHVHLHEYHHHPIPRELNIPIPILSIPLKQSTNDIRLFFRSYFWLFRNQKPKPEHGVNEDNDATDRTSNANPLRRLLDHVQNPNSLNNTSTTPNTFMPVTTVLSPNPASPPASPITIPSSSSNQAPVLPYQVPLVMVPVPVPPPSGLGQTWCVARPDVSETILQGALDYACGFGGADCTAIQFMGSCYNPNSVRAHASYAFNSYYQKKPVPSRCDFSAAAMLVNVNPSSLNCTYPSSSVSNYNPTEKGGDSASGLPELNADYSGSMNALGSDNRAASSTNSIAISATVMSLIVAFSVAHIHKVF